LGYSGWAADPCADGYSRPGHPLAETLGVIVFEEQVLRVAMAVADFAPAQADRLRRAMSRHRSAEAMAVRQRFFGAQARGLDQETAVEIWGQLAGFAGFGFCKSHAAPFALLAYQTLYLRAHFPAEFFCALLNHQPLGFYPPEVLLVGDARRHGVAALPADVNRSQAACTLEPAGPGLAIRLGMGYVQGVGEAGPARIVEQRGEAPFQNLDDLCWRTRLPRAVVENLIRAGALDALGRRRDLLCQLGGLLYQVGGLELAADVKAVELPDVGHGERLAWEYELLGLVPGDHVMRPRPPTANGMLFITLEDEDGLLNLIVRPGLYASYREALRNAPLLWVEGRLQREGSVSIVLEYRPAPL